MSDIRFPEWQPHGWVIRWKGETADGLAPNYISYDREECPRTGYAYCCLCASTKAFNNREGAERALAQLGLCPQRHEVVEATEAAGEMVHEIHENHEK